MIHVRQPAIVLLDPNEAGSLLVEPVTDEQKETYKFWQEHAIIHILGTRSSDATLSRVARRILLSRCQRILLSIQCDA